MMAVFELLLQDGQRQRVPSLGSLGPGDPIPEQAFTELMMDAFELLLQNGQRQRVPSLGSLGPGDPIRVWFAATIPWAWLSHT
jgi:hypothetical protein